MDLLQLIIDYYIAQKLASKKDLDIFKNFSPAKPDNAISIYEYTGSSVAPFSDVSVRSIQVVVRNTNGRSAEHLSWKLFRSIYRENLILTLGGKKCIVAYRNTPIKIDVDKSQRKLWAFNLGITISFN